MRILHVNKFLYRRGGAEGYMIDLAGLQSAQGHEVAFFGMEHPENDLPVVGTPPSHVEFEPPPPGVAARLELVGRMLWSRSAARGMTEAIQAFKPDVVHAHNVYHQLSPSVVHAARRAAVPVVLTMHDYKLVCPTYQFLDRGRLCTACVDQGPWEAARRACKDGSRAASTAAAVEVALHRRLGAYGGVGRFVAPSEFLAAQVRRAGVFPERIRVQSNFTDLAPPPGAVESRPVVVFAGRLSQEKGVDTLVRAVGRLDRGSLDTPHSEPLLEVAGDGPVRADLEQLAAQVAPGRVRFHGRLARPDLQRLVRSATASVVPSRWYENQPLAVLESFALGVPVIGTDLGGLPELVDGDTGWLVAPDDDVALAVLLAAVLADPAEAARRGLGARSRVEQHHSPEGHLAGILRIYAEAGGVG